MKYVDGFVIPVAKKNLAAYLKMAKLGAKVWREYGALEYRECVGDDLKIKGMPTSFPAKLKLKPNETLVFSWIVYKSRAHRDRVNAKVMKDPPIEWLRPDVDAVRRQRDADGRVQGHRRPLTGAGAFPISPDLRDAEVGRRSRTQHAHVIRRACKHRGAHTRGIRSALARS